MFTPAQTTRLLESCLLEAGVLEAAAEVEQRKIRSGPRAGQTGYFNLKTKRFMPPGWKPAGEKKTGGDKTGDDQKAAGSGRRSQTGGRRATGKPTGITKSLIGRLKAKYDQLVKAGTAPEDVVAAIARKLDPSRPVETKKNLAGLADKVVERVEDFVRRNPSQSYSMPQLYRDVIEPNGVSVGEYHDMLRRLSREGRVRLIEWTQPLRTMPDERFALIAGGEIRYYVRIK